MPGEPVAQVSLGGDEWVEAPTPEGVPARVLRSQDGAWTAGLFWERSAGDDPAVGFGALQEPGGRTVTYVVMDGKLTRLDQIRTAKPDPQAMVAYVRGCGQHDCDKFAHSRGGLSAQEIDAAVSAVTSKDGRRKVVLGFTPPKSMLSNAFIPCLHADPYFGDLELGDTAEASGVIVFTDGDLESAVGEAVGLEWLRGAGS